MAVYKKTYRPYEGALTAQWSRPAVIARYAFEDMRQRRFLTIFFAGSFIYPLVCALIIWVEHNLSALRLLNLENTSRLLPIDVSFFMALLGWQSMLALFITSFTGPGLISPDLSNNALSLYLARPFSRFEYVLGKMSVLVVLLSLMTWVPGLLLFGLQGYLEGWNWVTGNARIASGIFFGAWLWILVLSLLSLALSAWVRWKPAAGALVFGVFFVAAAFGAVINGVQRTYWGHLFNIGYLVGSVWVRLFEGAKRTTNGALFFRVPQGETVPLWCCWAALAALCLLCLYMLHRRIRGAEVVQ